MFSIISISNLPPALDHILTYTAIIVVVVMLELFIVDLIAPQPPPWLVHFWVLVGICFVLAILVVACDVRIPAEGILAHRLRWSAISAIIFLGSVLIGSAIAAVVSGDVSRWEPRKVVRFYTALLSIDLLIIYVIWVFFA